MQMFELPEPLPGISRQGMDEHHRNAARANVLDINAGMAWLPY
jgi:hypothetical protein